MLSFHLHVSCPDIRECLVRFKLWAEGRGRYRVESPDGALHGAVSIGATTYRPEPRGVEDAVQRSDSDTWSGAAAELVGTAAAPFDPDDPVTGYRVGARW